MSDSGMVDTDPDVEAPVDQAVPVNPDETELIDAISEADEDKDREEVVAAYQAAMQDRSTLLNRSFHIQNKLADYFRRKRSDESQSQQSVDKNITDQENRYLKYMANVDDLTRQLAQVKDQCNMQLEEMRIKRTEKQNFVNKEWEALLARKREIAKNAVFGRSGKALTTKEIDSLEEQERKKETEVCQARLENIRQKHRLKKRELALKQKEELAAGLHLIDFEQLKIENQTYNEKIEERNEDLLKLKRKIESTVQVLTHLKEKLEYVTEKNEELESELERVENWSQTRRDELAKLKQQRDKLRTENIKLQQKMGLLGKTDLLCDFERQIDESVEMKGTLEHLKCRHTELKRENQIHAKKIEKAKQQAEAIMVNYEL